MWAIFLGLWVGALLHWGREKILGGSWSSVLCMRAAGEGTQRPCDCQAPQRRGPHPLRWVTLCGAFFLMIWLLVALGAGGYHRPLWTSAVQQRGAQEWCVRTTGEGPQWSHTIETGITPCSARPPSSSPISILKCGDVHPHPGPPSEIKDLEQSGEKWGQGPARVGMWARRSKGGEHQHFKITVVIDDLIKAVRKGKVVPLHSHDVSSGKWEFLSPPAPPPNLNALVLDLEDGTLGQYVSSSASGSRARPRPRMVETPSRTTYSPSPIAPLRQAKLDTNGDEEGEQGLSDEEPSEGEEDDKPLVFFDVAGIEGEVITPELTRHAGAVMGTLPTLEWGSKSAWTCISWNSRGGAPPPKELKDFFRKEGVGVIGIQETRGTPMKGWGKAAVFCSPGASQQGGVQTVVSRWMMDRADIRDEDVSRKVIPGSVLSISLPIILPKTQRKHRLIITNVYRPVTLTEQP